MLSEVFLRCHASERSLSPAFCNAFATLLQRFVWYNSPIFEKRGGIGYAGTEYPDEYAAEKEVKERYLK